MGVDLAGDGLGQGRAGRHQGADILGTRDQGAQEAEIVGKGCAHGECLALKKPRPD
jgi:hypothetical protein